MLRLSLCRRAAAVRAPTRARALSTAWSGRADVDASVGSAARAALGDGATSFPRGDLATKARVLEECARAAGGAYVPSAALSSLSTVDDVVDFYWRRSQRLQEEEKELDAPPNLSFEQEM